MATETNEAVTWAREVVQRGMPAKGLPIEERADALADLAAAYGVLAAHAIASDDEDALDRYLSLSELSERFEGWARDLRTRRDGW